MPKQNNSNSKIELAELGSVDDKENKEKKYLDLISKLCGRYIQMRKRTGEQKSSK